MTGCHDWGVAYRVGGLITLTASTAELDHLFEGWIDLANGSECAPSFMKVE